MTKASIKNDPKLWKSRIGKLTINNYIFVTVSTCGNFKIFSGNRIFREKVSRVK